MERPVGVTVIAVLDFIGAGFLVLAALAMMLLGGVMAARMANGMPLGMLGGAGLAVVAVFCLGFAVLGVVIGVGLLKLQNWARVVTIVLTGLGALFAVLGLLGGVMSPGMMFGGGLIVRQIVTLAIDGWILWYMFQPHVKQAFGTTGF